MRLATRDDGTRDGRLVVVSAAGDRAAEHPSILTLREALEDWGPAEESLRSLAREVDAGRIGEPFSDAEALAPLPRTWQWLDGSTYSSHGDLMARSLGVEPIVSDEPLMYQGMSHTFLAPYADVPFPSEDGEIDFEGELGVVLVDTPAGIDAHTALEHIALFVLVNDWSLRAVVVGEMQRRFGYIVGKPACGAAPLAVTPDELGGTWQGGKARLVLHVALNGTRFGDVPTDGMSVGFGELIAHAARTRDLPAGTIVGAGTTSSRDYARAGSACVAERRGIEILQTGAAVTSYLSDGDVVTMTASAGNRSLFGRLQQRVAVGRSRE
ncbi:fumarylacetoacetate hydrolase family protein [Microbacterium album]|uniref:2-keto-4-pentenoate hydratase n=1 Tax=Microbacterium album TaxID=2053191 RepID=A0A917MMH5_9MICO|nr:fumarylacetoacetate hydrolase family protein [Microbacterium album]GGH47236.1 2-keto-4-pentenoate hydratase [Microbacterium album]